MAILVERTDTSFRETADRIEQVIRDAIGERQKENWKVSIELNGRFCEVTIKAPVQTRSEIFYDEPSKLPGKIATWLSLYPLK